MKSVNVTLPKQNNIAQPPLFPNMCCYCGAPAHDTIQVDVGGGVKLAVPYCEIHFSPAGEYINKVIPKLMTLNFIYLIALGIALTSVVLMVIELSGGLFVQICVGLVVFIIAILFGVFTLRAGGGDLLFNWALNRQIKKLGFTDLVNVAPGIYKCSTLEQPDSGKIQLTLIFSNDSYADLFQSQQQEAG
jgi:hypothetical protein